MKKKKHSRYVPEKINDCLISSLDGEFEETRRSWKYGGHTKKKKKKKLKIIILLQKLIS